MVCIPPTTRSAACDSGRMGDTPPAKLPMLKLEMDDERNLKLC